MDAPLGAKFKTTTDMYKAWVQPLHQVRYWSSEVVKSYWADNTLASKEWFDLDLWTCDLKINSDHLLIKCNLCTRFGIDQVKGSKDFVRTTHWARKSGLTLTIEHLTWKSIEIIYSLRATPASSLVLIKRRGQTTHWARKSGLTLTFANKSYLLSFYACFWRHPMSVGWDV